MERGIVQTATAAISKDSPRWRDCPSPPWRSGWSEGGLGTSATLDKALVAMILDEAAKALVPASRILTAKNQEGGCVLIYGEDPTGIGTASTAKKPPRNLVRHRGISLEKAGLKKTRRIGSIDCSRRLKDNPLAPVIMAVEEKTRIHGSISPALGLFRPGEDGAGEPGFLPGPGSLPPGLRRLSTGVSQILLRRKNEKRFPARTFRIG
jgi:hypothetical protein